MRALRRRVLLCAGIGRQWGAPLRTVAVVNLPLADLSVGSAGRETLPAFGGPLLIGLLAVGGSLLLLSFGRFPRRVYRVPRSLSLAAFSMGWGTSALGQAPLLRGACATAPAPVWSPGSGRCCGSLVRCCGVCLGWRGFGGSSVGSSRDIAGAGRMGGCCCQGRRRRCGVGGGRRWARRRCCWVRVCRPCYQCGGLGGPAIVLAP